MANQNQDQNQDRGGGFQNMDEEEQRRIAEKGSETVSEDREHMSEIGRKGGESRTGGQASQRSRSPESLEQEEDYGDEHEDVDVEDVWRSPRFGAQSLTVRGWNSWSSIRLLPGR